MFFEMNVMKSNLEVVEKLPLVEKKNQVPNPASVGVTINRSTSLK
jgi:hypothetical protein